jgi:catalase
MRTDGNHGSTIAYEPNSRDEWRQQTVFGEPRLPVSGGAGHWDHRTDDDYYSQVGELFRRMDARRRQLLFENTARAMADVTDDVCQRHVKHCTQADPAYGAGVAAALRQLRG